jgi:hypothetical protein
MFVMIIWWFQFTQAISLELVDQIIPDFFCVMYSGEYDVCDVTLTVYPHPGKLEKYAWPR